MSKRNVNIVTRYDTYGEIITRNGDRVLVDAVDLPTVAKYSWYVTSRGYAASRINGKIVYLHRMLMNPQDLQVDHINRCKLDNRRHNLRVVTNQQNHFNMGVNCRNKSGHRGIYWNKDCQKWCVQITLAGKVVSSTLHSTLQDAISKRKALEHLYWGV